MGIMRNGPPARQGMNAAVVMVLSGDGAKPSLAQLAHKAASQAKMTMIARLVDHLH